MEGLLLYSESPDFDVDLIRKYLRPPAGCYWTEHKAQADPQN